jgi:hypothetical protein
MDGLDLTSIPAMERIRYQGKWLKIKAKPYEPETQTAKVAWEQIRDPSIGPEDAYRKYYETQRKEVKILYPSFRKEDVD